MTPPSKAVAVTALAPVAGLVCTASLFVVGVTSAVGVISHARRGRVMWRTGLIFGAAGMAGAFIGGLLGGHIPGQILLIAFAIMMVATSLAMLRGRTKKNDGGAAPVKRELPLGRVLLDGAIVGSLIGAKLAGRIPETALRKAFGWFVLAMGTFVLIQQAPPGLQWPIAAGVATMTAATAGICWLFVSSCPLRNRGHHSTDVPSTV